MIRLKANRVRLEPKAKALDQIRRFAGCRRFVWNRLLADRQAAYASWGQQPSDEAKKEFNRAWSYEGMAARITHWRAETEWLADCPIHTLQNAAKDLFTAYVNWWEGRTESPRFKKKGRSIESWTESDPACFRVNGQAVKLPKIGWVRARISTKIRGNVKRITVKRIGDHWTASILTEERVEDPKPNGKPSIGLDVGAIQDVTDSNGTIHDLGTATEREEKRLKRLSRDVSKKEKGSKNRQKAQKRVNRARSRILRRVLHETNTLTFRMAKNHGLVAVEGLDVQAMTASAAGTREEPGKNVAQKRGLNREILKRGWSEIRRQLGYKCHWYGSKLEAVPAPYSSQECAECGHVSPDNRRTRDLFHCVGCEYRTNADHNAARVIEKRGILQSAAGHAASACGERVRPLRRRRRSAKQEPARVVQKCAI